LALNLAKQGSLYKELKDFQISNSELIKENYAHKNKNDKLEVQVELLNKAINQTENQLELVIKDRNNLQNEVMKIKQANNSLESEKKLFDQKISILQEENSNLRLNRNNNDVQTGY